MADQTIAGFSAPNSLTGIRPVGSERAGRHAGSNAGAAPQNEGGKYQVRGHINVAHGNFDADAPRGTYLDILV